PENVPGLTYLEDLARLRGDDLVSGGILASSDPASAMQEAARASQEYHRLYEQHMESAPQPEGDEAPAALPEVERLVYELMSERDRLGELSKLVGTLRFAVERGDEEMLRDAEAKVRVIGTLLPEHFWVDKLA